LAFLFKVIITMYGTVNLKWLVIYLNCTMMHGLTNLKFLVVTVHTKKKL